MVPLTPPVTPPIVVRPYDPPSTAYGAGHRGLDVAAVTGQPVRAMAAGTVAFAGSVAGIPVVTVEHAGGLRSTYEPVVPGVAEGDVVAAGQPLGTVAPRGGHCGGEPGCLHVGLRRAGAYLDPATLLAPAVLRTLRPRPGDGPAGR